MDFGKIRRTTSVSKPKNPIEIFKTLPSLDGAPNDLWSGQGEALREWDKARNQGDVVLSLTTGAGKTVVGLLIAQSLVNEGVRNVVYLCSTNDLVAQTSEEARKIGIGHTTRSYGKWSNDLFETEKGFCITNYAALFNGHSTIARRHRPEAIIFDDAHVAESVMRDAFTLKIKNDDHAVLFRAITTLFADDFTSMAIGSRFEKAAGKGGGEMVMATPRAMISRANQLRQIIDSHGREYKDLAYASAHLSDHLAACSMVISDGQLEIAPPFVPTLALRGFQSDVRRVYLSATLQSQVEFVRAFGRIPSTVIQPETDAGNGERLILDGRELDGGFGPDFVRRLTKLRKAVVAVPSYGKANRWGGLATPPKVANFTEELNSFRKAHNGVFTLVSRADGIDLPADACRIMVMDGLPTGSSLLERFQYEFLEMQSAQDRRIAGRVTQLFGRINRGRNDYGVFLIEGKELGIWLGRDRSVALLPALLRKQVIVGRNVQDDMGIGTPDKAMDIAEAVLNRDQGWVDFYREEVRGADLEDGVVERAEEAEAGLVKAALAEAQYALAMWEADFSKARQHLESVASDTELADTRLSGWHEVWIAATHDAEGDAAAANDHYSIAAKRLPTYLKLPKHAATIASIGRQAESDPFVEQMLRLTSSADVTGYEKALRRVRDDLGAIDAGSTRQAEAGVRRLGELLGYVSTRPDNDNLGTGPDVAWEDQDKRSILGFELKTDKVPATASYSKKKDIGQGHDHLQWLADNYPEHTRHGLIYVGPDGPIESQANPAANMWLCTTARMVDLRNEWLALVGDIRGLTPAARPERLKVISDSGDWALESLIRRLGAAFVVKQ
ncbi:DEAD/DEAH box helicase family protein [Phaeobacter inhibens]|uniref:DEAD/DEAH box helicase family protein n=1 Tax=Phaeobacter inhibens TaxID=221822 RepID=UPI000C9CF6E6|nr:DEAD/DEAH box helicase family protein [Phaeobacter inhibens]AUQ71138.1 DNA phosphorothioation system restriction enzyme [Phaeobacter inhibens]